VSAAGNIIQANAIEVSHISKYFPLSSSGWGKIKNLWSEPRPQDRDAGVWAVRDVSFSVARAEAFGIIGSNGSGKSTLLKIVAGIVKPTSGTTAVNGRMAALIELGTGFSPEFTGRANVYMNASLLGLSHVEIDERLESIHAFSGIGDFLEQPLRTYSTGMVLRLAFAIAVHVEPDILVVDEALAVGDIAFRQRCMRKIHDLLAGGTTLIFISHDVGDVKALCSRCLWLREGRVQQIGPTDEVTAAYLNATLQREEHKLKEEHSRIQAAPHRVDASPAHAHTFTEVALARRYGDKRASIIEASLTDSSGLRFSEVVGARSVSLRISYAASEDIESPIAGFLFRNSKGEVIFGSNTTRENMQIDSIADGETDEVSFHWIMPLLAAGVYRVSVAVCDGTLNDFTVCDYLEDVIEVTVKVNGSPVSGYLNLPCSSIDLHQHH
jgi:ABC-type polysaccharide/polyol phosphate transport system ATPase subunit